MPDKRLVGQVSLSQVTGGRYKPKTVTSSRTEAEDFCKAVFSSAVSLISRNVSFFQRIYHSPNRWETDFISNYFCFLELMAYRMIGRVSERRSASTKPADLKVEIKPV